MTLEKTVKKIIINTPTSVIIAGTAIIASGLLALQSNMIDNKMTKSYNKATSQEIYSLNKDLNEDGINDYMHISKDGNKTLLYSNQTDSGLTYSPK